MYNIIIENTHLFAISESLEGRSPARWHDKFSLSLPIGVDNLCVVCFPHKHHVSVTLNAAMMTINAN